MNKDSKIFVAGKYNDITWEADIYAHEGIIITFTVEFYGKT